MSEPREGRWTAKPINDFERYSAVGIWLNSLWMFGLFFLLLSPWPSKRIRLWIALAVVILYAATLLIFALRGALALQLRAQDRRLSDAIPGRDEFAVQIHVRRNGILVGSDRGVVWFEDSLLGFAGGRASFLLAATDLIAPKGMVLTALDAPFRPLKLNVIGTSKAEVWIIPLFGQGLRYRKKLSRFLKARVTSDRERQWPPLEPYFATKALGEAN